MKTMHSHLATLESVEAMMAETDRAIVPVVGDCLEGAGVQDGGWVAVAFDRYQAPPRYRNRGGDGSVDLCMCYATFPGTIEPTVMVKAYDGVFGSKQMVATMYKSMWNGGAFRPNCGMFAEKIFGVIFASWDKEGNLLWEREPDSFPATLETMPTIYGNNTGALVRRKVVPV